MLGIDRDGDSVFLVSLEKKRKRIFLHAMHSFHVSSLRENVKRLYIKKKWMGIEIKEGIAESIDSQNLLIKNIFLPGVQKKDLAKAALFQKQSILAHHPASSMALTMLEKQTKEGANLSFFITKQEAIEKSIEESEKNQYCIDILSGEPQALVRFAKWSHEEISSGVLLHVGNRKTLCVLMEESLPKMFSYINRGVQALLESAMQNLHHQKGQGSQRDLANNNINFLEERTEYHKKFQAELVKNLQFLFRHTQQKNLPVLVTGNVSCLLHFTSWLSTEMPGKFSSFLSAEKKEYALSLGAALEGEEQEPLQFRKGRFSPLSYHKKILGYATAFLSVCLLGSIGIYQLGSYCLQKHRQSMEEKIFSLQRQEKTLTPFTKWSFSLPIEEKMKKLKIGFEQQQDSWLYSMKTPSVTDLIAWYNQISLPQEIELVSFEYELLSYPDKEHPLKPFVAKVHIQGKGPLEAKELFKEQLMKETAVLDANRPVDWKLEKDSFSFSFFVKNSFKSFKKTKEN